MSVDVEKIPGGRVDSMELLKGKCGCTSLAKCCYSWSQVKKKDSEIIFEAKMTTPDTKDHHSWGYIVKKDGVSIRVPVEDARDKEIYSGFMPPSAALWKEKGWELIEVRSGREDGPVWHCTMCKGKEEGIPFVDLPDDWRCPECNVPKDEFEEIG